MAGRGSGYGFDPSQGQNPTPRGGARRSPFDYQFETDDQTLGRIRPPGPAEPGFGFDPFSEQSTTGTNPLGQGSTSARVPEPSQMRVYRDAQGAASLVIGRNDTEGTARQRYEEERQRGDEERMRQMLAGEPGLTGRRGGQANPFTQGDEERMRQMLAGEPGLTGRRGGQANDPFTQGADGSGSRGTPMPTEISSPRAQANADFLGAYFAQPRNNCTCFTRDVSELPLNLERTARECAVCRRQYPTDWYPTR